MKIGIRKAGNTVILDLNGPLKLGPDEKAFLEEVQKQLDEGTKNLAVNLAGVPVMDSSGIGALVRAYTSVKRAGGKCKFFAAGKLVTQTLRMVRLDSVLELFEDEPSALASF